MRRALISACLFAALTGMPAMAQISPPSGWEQRQEGSAVIVSNGNATVTIGPWQSLDGLSTENWLAARQDVPPNGARLTAVEPIRKETVPGAYSITRSANFGGQTGLAILYACPGKGGDARLMTLDVRDGGFLDTLAGASYGEAACKDAIARYNASVTAPSATVPLPPSTQAPTGSLAEQNAAIPPDLRPISADLRTDWVWKGFPAIRTLELTMVLNFADGTRLGCSDWVPDGSTALQDLARDKACRVEGERSDKLIHGFDPGDSFDIRYGRIAASAITGLEGSASSLRGGDLVMTADGQIALSGWNVGAFSSNAASARATSTSRDGITGRYYVDGHTITIRTRDGEVLHGLIGYTRDDAGGIDTVFLNGEWYRDRDG